MKRKDGFIVRELAGQNIVLAVGEASKIFRGMIKLNTTGLFIWERLANDVSEEQIVDALIESYEVERERASADVRRFVSLLAEAGIIE